MDLPEPNVVLFRTENLGNFNIKKMIVNGLEIKEPKNIFYFEEEGVKMNISFSLTLPKTAISFKKLFYDIRELYYIKIIQEDQSKSLNVESMEEMFSFCTNLRSINFGNVKISELKSLKNIFKDNEALIDINFGNLDTSKVETTHGMFNL